MSAALTHDLIVARQRFGQRTAVEASGRSFTYRDLCDSAVAYADELVRRGVRSGDRVAIVLPRQIEAYVWIYAALFAGAAYVPVDVTTPVERLKSILADAQPTAIVSLGRILLAAGGEDSGAPFRPDDVVVASLAGDSQDLSFGSPMAVSSEPATAARSVDDHQGCATDLAYLLYTSGSTGTPKGVVHTHSSARAFVDWATQHIQLRPSDRVSQASSLAFDLSTFEIFATVQAGATLVAMPDAARLHIGAATRFLKDTEISVCYSVPSLLLRGSSPAAWKILSGSALRALILAGEPIHKARLVELAKSLPTDCRIENWYGPTETNVCTYHGVTDGDLARGGEIPIGRACPYAELELVASLVDAEIQSVCVRGGSTMAGYWDARRRIAVSPVNETGFYATGDLVRRNDLGELLYAGRSDRQIKIHGYRIQLEEVEHAARRVPLVADAAAAKVQGANGPMIGLCVEGLADDAASLDVLRKNLRRRLPFYVEPEIIRILNALPRCSRGKVDYRAVASTLQNVAMQDSG